MGIARSKTSFLSNVDRCIMSSLAKRLFGKETRLLRTARCRFNVAMVVKSWMCSHYLCEVACVRVAIFSENSWNVPVPCSRGGAATRGM